MFLLFEKKIPKTIFIQVNFFWAFTFQGMGCYGKQCNVLRGLLKI